jgi:poly(A) polymerase
MELESLLSSLSESLESLGIKGYVVGGLVRDKLTNRTPKDIDLVVASDHQNIIDCVYKVLNVQSSFIDKKHKIHKVILPIKTMNTANSEVDITFQNCDLTESLSARDFTINALALPLEHYNDDNFLDHIIDPHNGIADIRGKIIRMVKKTVFVDDPTRMIRAVRIASSLQFTIGTKTNIQIKNDAKSITLAPMEIIGEELLRILENSKSKAYIEILDRLNLLEYILPELVLTKGVTQPKEHYWDVWQHSLHTLDFAERLMNGHQNSPIYSMAPWTVELEAHFSQLVNAKHSHKVYFKLAALLHDIAKPQTKTLDETGRTRFPKHAIIGAQITKQRLESLKIDKKSIIKVKTMIESHLRPNHMLQGVNSPTRKAIYKYFKDLGESGIDVLFIHLADYLAAKGPDLTLSDWATRAKMVNHIIDVHNEQTIETKKYKLIDGHQLMEHFNLKPSNEVGELLSELNEAQGLGRIHTYDEAIKLATELINNNQG